MKASESDQVCFDETLIKRYDGRGPRYTSYPTALQFDANLTVDMYQKNALASNASGLPLSLYVHIPFCQTLCYYCGCNKIVTRNQARIGKYLEDLHAEIDMQSELFATDRKVEQLHFGGGTPTYLSDDQLGALLRKLRSRFTFDDSGAHEFSIEVDPRTVTETSMHMLGGMGFNRLSLGIQDFDEAVQSAVNRLQSIEEVQGLLDTSRAAGFRSVSFDLIYGLPHQTATSFDATLDIVIGMRPDRLAVYNYAHLPERFKGQRMINDADLPSPQEKLDILHHTIDRLAKAGYVYIGMDHFALPEDDLVRARHERSLQRNFQGYSTHRQCDLIGLGVSAIGSIGNVYSQNAVSTIEYQSIIEDGQLPVIRGITVDADDMLRASVIQALMCYDALSFAAFNAEHDIDFEAYFAKEIDRLEPMVDDDLVNVDAQGIAITPKGRLLLRSIAMVFDRYIDADQHGLRYSKAI